MVRYHQTEVGLTGPKYATTQLRKYSLRAFLRCFDAFLGGAWFEWLTVWVIFQIFSMILKYMFNLYI